MTRMKDEFIVNWQVNRALSTPLSEQLASSIRWSISVGQLLAGDRLPPLRGLAKELSLSVSSVNTAYRILADEGLVVMRPHHGTIISGSQEPDTSAHTDGCEFKASFSLTIGQAMSTGLKHEEISAIFCDALAQVSSKYLSRPILFVECSEFECQALGNQIANALQTQVDTVRVKDLHDHLDTTATEYALVVTSFFHYAQVMKESGRIGAQVYAVVVDMSAEAEQFVQSLRPGNTIGIVCGRYHGLPYIVNHFQKLNNDINVTTAYADEQYKIDQMLSFADAIFMSPEFEGLMSNTSKRPPVFYFVNRVNERSLHMLREYYSHILLTQEEC